MTHPMTGGGAIEKPSYQVAVNAVQAWVVLRFQKRELAVIAMFRGGDYEADAQAACDALNKASDMQVTLYPAYHEVVAQ